MCLLGNLFTDPLLKHKQTIKGSRCNSPEPCPRSASMLIHSQSHSSSNYKYVLIMLRYCHVISGPTHALDGLPPRARGQRSFRCADKSYWTAKQSGNEASQFFFMLVLALLVSFTGETQPTPAQTDFSILSVLALVGSRFRDYLACILQ